MLISHTHENNPQIMNPFHFLTKNKLVKTNAGGLFHVETPRLQPHNSMEKKIHDFMLKNSSKALPL